MQIKLNNSKFISILLDRASHRDRTRAQGRPIGKYEGRPIDAYLVKLYIQL